MTALLLRPLSSLGGHHQAASQRVPGGQSWFCYPFNLFHLWQGPGLEHNPNRCGIRTLDYWLQDFLTPFYPLPLTTGAPVPPALKGPPVG